MPLRDKKHLALIRMLPCLIGVDCMGDVVPAHISKFSGRGTSIKADDDRCIPLCFKHHDEQHRKGEMTFHGGYDGVWKAIELAKALYGKDIFAARRLIMEYRNGR